MTQNLDLTAIVNQGLAALTLWQLFWILIIATGFDIASQVVADLAAKNLDPRILAKLANQIIGAFVSAGFVLALGKLAPGNTSLLGLGYSVYAFALFSTVSSFAQHSRETCETLKIPVPYWLGMLTSFLAAFPSKFPPAPPADPTLAGTPGPATTGG